MFKKKLLASISILAISSTLVAPPASAQASNNSVRIGVLTDMTGQFSHEAGEGSVTAIRMAVEDFGGKVLGRPIEVIFADHQNKPDIGAAKAREWYDSGIDMIAGLINSGVALSVTNVAKDKNKIAIINGSGSSRLTNEGCTPVSIHYAYDTYALATGTTRYLIREQKLDTWYFLTADYAFGHALEADATAMINANGGKVIGSTRYPMDTTDHSSFLLRAQASKAKVVAMAGSGQSFISAVRSAQEFGLTKGGRQTLAGLLVWDTDIHALGLKQAQGMVMTTAFYWDRTPETRAWAKRFQDRMKRMPHMGDAGDYSSTMHYLKAIQAAGTDETGAVMAKMKSTPINDFFATNGRIREDGRMVHDMYVYQVKTPAESKYAWDYLTLKETIPAAQAFRPLSESSCYLVKK
jgi:branched-chain amino acid transport system substrate-binding protein